MHVYWFKSQKVSGSDLFMRSDIVVVSAKYINAPNNKANYWKKRQKIDAIITKLCV